MSNDAPDDGAPEINARSAQKKRKKMQSNRTSWITRSLFIWMVFLLAAPVMSQENQAGSYRINPGDRLQVSVWREDDLQLDVLVRPDGGISMPLAGDIRAAGKSVEELQTEVAEQLRRYIPDPTVSVAVSETRGNVVYVIGKVIRPGELVIARPVDVVQVLSMAGGMTEFAAVNKIRILRRENGRQVAVSFKYSEVEKGENLEQNITLKSGDVVIVP